MARTSKGGDKTCIKTLSTFFVLLKECYKESDGVSDPSIEYFLRSNTPLQYITTA